MSAKKFIELVKKTLDLDEVKKSNKKKSIKCLLKKLRNKKGKLNKELKAKPAKKKKQELLEDKEIILVQIQKGKEILKKLNSEKEKDGK